VRAQEFVPVYIFANVRASIPASCSYVQAVPKYTPPTNSGRNAKKKSGYRDILVNLRIANDLTRRLGLDFNICELQLVLKQFFLLKKAEGHARYVTFRNMRCE
jgi:hypothetical protein